MFYFYGRLTVAPQTRLETWTHTPGFDTLDECKDFCNKIFFAYTIYQVVDGGKKKVFEQK